MTPYTATEAAFVWLALAAYVLAVFSLFKAIKVMKPHWEMRAELTAGAIGFLLFAGIMWLAAWTLGTV